MIRRPSPSPARAIFTRVAAQAKKAGYDTWYEIQADKILHPQFFQQGGYPIFEPQRADPLLSRYATLVEPPGTP